MKNEQDSASIEPLLASTADTCKILGIPRRSFERHRSTGRIGPTPIRLGGRKLYRVAELKEWVAAGCPPREVWADRTRRQAPSE